MRSLELKNGITWVGSLDPNLRVFDIIMETEFGTTYNSYIVKGESSIALFETVKIKCFDEYLERLKELVDISKIEYIVVDHTEPDHVGSVEKMLDINPEIKIVGSKTAIKFLKGIVNREFNSIVVNTGDTIDLGNKTLEFIMAPFLHWPDTMYTYIREDKVLITCDSFGAHYSFEDVLLSKVTKNEDYMSALLYYFNMIMGPFKNHVLTAISKIENLEIDQILPGHGPVLDKNPWEIVELYRKWATETSIFDKKTVVIPYVSAYGYTETIATEIKKGILSEENIDALIYDMVIENKVEVLEKIKWADGLLFGSPTINGDALPPIWNLLMEMSPIEHGRKLAAAFGSYGWSGEAVENLESRFKMIRLKHFEKGLKINFKPSEDELKLSFEYGKRFAQTILGTYKKVDMTPKSINTHKPIIESDGTIKKWICIVCDEIFEGELPPEICPVCGAAQDQFIQYVEETNKFVSEDMLSIFIIGNGIAGLSAAKAIRTRNKNAMVSIISAESEITYSRPMLSDYLQGDYDKNLFYIENQEWYKENHIELILNTKIISINTDKKSIKSDKNKIYNYDKLILASGSHNFIPPITDIHKKGVYSIKDIEDVREIKKNIIDYNKVVVIGGGLLGIEAAEGLKNLVKDVTILEVADGLARLQLDLETSNYLLERVIKSGVKVMTNVNITLIAGDDYVTGVQLENGQILDADLVLVSTGIRSNIGICNNTDIEYNKGILVNTKMETNIKDVYAAGDICEFDGVVYGIWPASTKQGEIAGANAVGDSKEFEHFVPSIVLNAFGVELFSIGLVYSSKKENYSTLIFDDMSNGSYEKIVFENNILKGAILLGDMKNTSNLISGIKNGSTKEEIIKELFK